MSISDHEEMIDDIEETPRNEEEKYHQTIESIEKINNDSPVVSIRVIHLPVSPSPEKRLKMEEFINSLPDILISEDDIQ